MRDTKTKLWIDLCNMIYTFRVTFICELKQQSKILKLYFFFSCFLLFIEYFTFQGNHYYVIYESLTSSFRLSHLPHGLSSKISLSSSESSPLSLGDLCSASLLLDRLPGMTKFCGFDLLFFFLLETFLFLFCYTPLSTKNYPFNFSRLKLT